MGVLPKAAEVATKEHDALLRFSAASTTAIFPADYPILEPPGEDMRRLMGVVGPPRVNSLEMRRLKRSELRRIRDSFSQMWFICVVTLAAIAVPAGLIIAPIVTFEGSRSTRGGFPVWTPPTTAYPWTNVPSWCLRKVKLDDDIKHLTIHNTTLQTPSAHRGDVICLFNNTRFRKRQRYDYAPQSMPLSLCNSLLYWSLAISEGRVQNRVPEFDVHHGVWKLHTFVPSLAQGGSLPKLLVSLGGHIEDSAHFARLSRDVTLHTKLAASLMRFSIKHQIGGAVVHWKDMGGTCGSPSDINVMATVLASFARLRFLNKDDYATGVIVPADAALARTVTLTATVHGATLIIYETHRLHAGDVFTMCSSTQAEAVTLMNDMNAAAASVALQQMGIRPPPAPPRLCISLTAGLPVSRAYNGSPPAVLPNFVPLGDISHASGIMAVYEFCAVTSVAQVSSYPAPSGCASISKRLVNRTTDLVTLPGGAVVPVGTAVEDYYAFVAQASIKAQYQATSSNSDLRCAAVYDLDLDLYKGGCSAARPHYGIRNIEEAIQ
ncbi:hypothetical protein V5799_004820 [Amblyomma americanum]|uniref:Uncharacterized protein n=1 Tax=Amblyomma americanum TaxID=6943 RepID=A0AAQ4D510_AMBAM